MAARRLLVAMLVFLAISTVLAALAPQPTEPDRETTTAETTSPSTAGQPRAPGRLVRRGARLEASERGLRAQPGHVNVHPGDQLALTVSVPRVITLEIASLGLTETAAPGAPARFDLFISAPGRHAVRDATLGRRLLRIVSRERER